MIGFLPPTKEFLTLVVADHPQSTLSEIVAIVGWSRWTKRQINRLCDEGILGTVWDNDGTCYVVRYYVKPHILVLGRRLRAEPDPRG
jgi:hypothetical protein